MNVNDLPPAAKLVALIEAGRAANPDLEHGRFRMFRDNAVCALGFAALGAGFSRECIAAVPGPYCALGDAIGIKHVNAPDDILCRVYTANDLGTPLEEICASLREGELAKVPA